jgi:hypothetical protein
MFELQSSADGGRSIRPEKFALSKLDALRHPGEGSSWG